MFYFIISFLSPFSTLQTAALTYSGIHCSPHFGTVCKLAESTCYSIIHVINRDIKWY